jgi:hypothetical protein
VSRPRKKGAQRVAERRRESLDIFIGVLGFFTVLLLVSTVLAEVKGQPSVARALTLAVFVALVYACVRMRRTLLRQSGD